MTSNPPAPESSFMKWNFILGWALMGVGMLVFFIALGSVVWNTTKGIDRIALPGARVLTLKKPGIYVSVYQHKAGQGIPAQDLARMEIMLSESASGNPVPLARIPGAQVFSMAGQAGTLLFQTEIAEPGEYFLSANYPAGAPGPSIETLLIHESIQNNRADLTVGIIVCLVLVGFGIYVLIKTSNVAKAAQMQAVRPPEKKKKK
jgi:hypothetical protein